MTFQPIAALQAAVTGNINPVIVAERLYLDALLYWRQNLLQGLEQWPVYGSLFQALLARTPPPQKNKVTEYFEKFKQLQKSSFTARRNLSDFKPRATA